MFFILETDQAKNMILVSNYMYFFGRLFKTVINFCTIKEVCFITLNQGKNLIEHVFGIALFFS